MNVHMSWCKVHVIFVRFHSNLSFLERIFEKYSNFMNILSVGAELFHADRHDEAKNRFRHFVNASKNDTDTF